MADLHPTDSETIKLAAQTWFFVGGEYVEDEHGVQLEGAAYVEHYEPETCTQPYPVVMFHGGVQTGTNFTSTPDGRRGWLHDFLRAGYTVYVFEQPERGRSGHALDVVNRADLMRYDAVRVERMFTAPAASAAWPQARHHTQWPGSGCRGDASFDNFFASQVPMLKDRDEIERLTRNAGVALLDRIGPAILLTHSQSGPFGWLLGDARPELVRGIIALEPNGPPFFEVEFQGGEDFFRYAEELSRPYGITRQPLTFDPPIDTACELQPTLSEMPDNPELVRGFLQQEPARKLTSLAGIPILILVAEASYHASYDHCTSAFLTQAGVPHYYVALADVGLKGNGHMAMLEENNHETADVMLQWLEDQYDA